MKNGRNTTQTASSEVDCDIQHLAATTCTILATSESPHAAIIHYSNIGTLGIILV